MADATASAIVRPAASAAYNAARQRVLAQFTDHYREDDVKRALLSVLEQIKGDTAALRQADLKTARQAMQSWHDSREDVGSPTNIERLRLAAEKARCAFNLVSDPLDKIRAVSIIVYADYHHVALTAVSGNGGPDWTAGKREAQQLLKQYLGEMPQLASAAAEEVGRRSSILRRRLYRDKDKRRAVLREYANLSAAVFDLHPRGEDADRARFPDLEEAVLRAYEKAPIESRPRIGHIISKPREICTLRGHRDSIRCCSVFGPQETRLVTGSDDNTLIVWDLTSGKQICNLKGHKNYVRCCSAFGEQETMVVSGSDDKTLKVWDVNDATEIWTLKGHTREVNCCSIFREGKMVVSGSDDGTLKIWDIKTGKEIRTLEGHSSGVVCCSVFGEKDARVASGSVDTTLRIWDVASGREICVLQGHTGCITCCSAFQDGTMVVSGSEDSTLKVWNLSTFEETHTLKGTKGDVRCCSVLERQSPKVIGWSGFDAMTMWDLNTGEETLALESDAFSFNCCSIIGQQEMHIATGADDANVMMWHLPSLVENSLHVAKANSKQQRTNVAVRTHHVALLIGYDVAPPLTPATNKNGGCSGHNDDDRGRGGGSTTYAETVGVVVREAFQHALRTKYLHQDEGDLEHPQRSTTPTAMITTTSSSSDGNDDASRVQVVNSSQATLSKLSHRCLSQESGIASAVGDVMVFRVVSLPAALNTTSTSAQRREEIQKKHLLDVFREANHHLSLISPPDESLGVIRILSGIVLPSNIDAEQSCAQRVYHYLLPLKWLPGGDETRQWWLENQRLMQKEREAEPGDAVAWDEGNQSTTGRRPVGRFGITEGEQCARIPPPQPTLRTIKNALKKAESAKVSTSDIHNMQGRIERRKIGRFGALASKERRCWHNYAAPTLQGEACPSNELWKVLDRAKIVQLISYNDGTQQQGRSNKTTNDNATGEMGSNDEEEVLAIVEFRGDDFVQEQVRRIVATAVAISHGWLPENFFHWTLSPDIVLETPLAPPRRCYFAGARFHFDELSNLGRGLCDDADDNAFAVDLRKRMLHRLSAADVRRDEKKWLDELRDVVAPRLRKQLEEMKHRDMVRRRQRSH